jgi:hypothetical protein
VHGGRRRKGANNEGCRLDDIDSNLSLLLLVYAAPFYHRFAPVCSPFHDALFINALSL